MATAAGASTRLFWEAGGVRHPLENCSTGCLNERLDPCVDAVRVSQRYVESLAAGGPFRCEYDWPPWPEHLMPKVHFSPPQMAHVAPHDVAAAVTIERRAVAPGLAVWASLRRASGLQAAVLACVLEGAGQAPPRLPGPICEWRSVDEGVVF